MAKVVYIDAQEVYPVYGITPFEDRGERVELSDEEYEDWIRVFNEHQEWQQKFRKLLGWDE